MWSTNIPMKFLIHCGFFCLKYREIKMALWCNCAVYSLNSTLKKKKTLSHVKLIQCWKQTHAHGKWKCCSSVTIWLYLMKKSKLYSMSCSGLNSVEMTPSSGENTTLQCERFLHITERCTLLIPEVNWDIHVLICKIWYTPNCMRTLWLSYKPLKSSEQNCSLNEKLTFIGH